MTRIVDRRADRRNQNSVNRGRFLRRFRHEIRKAVADVVDQGGIRDLEDGRKIAIPAKDLNEPQFALGRGGIRERVHPGNDAFSTGDLVERPPSGKGGGGSQASPDGEGTDPFVFTLTREEFLELFFDELALPNLVKRQLATIKEQRWQRAGYSQTGVPANISFVRTMRGAAGRRLGSSGAARARARELEAALEDELRRGGEESWEAGKLKAELLALRRKLGAIPFLDTFDLRFHHRVRVSQPSTQAVMFCLMDVSGSMDEPKKNIAKRFFTLLYLFLQRNYERIDVVFIRHHTVAEEVDEQVFFHSRESGGTVVSTALKLMLQVIQERYSSSVWNIYGAQASDGDNWQEDSSICLDLMGGALVPLVQYFAYIEISQGKPQNLWHEYTQVCQANPGRFAMRRITAANEIYPVFHDLFRKRA